MPYFFIVPAYALLLVGLALAVGPRNPFGPDIPTPREAPPADLMALDGWLARGEAVYADLLPETERAQTQQVLVDVIATP